MIRTQVSAKRMGLLTISCKGVRLTDLVVRQHPSTSHVVVRAILQDLAAEFFCMISSYTTGILEALAAACHV